MPRGGASTWQPSLPPRFTRKAQVPRVSCRLQPHGRTVYNHQYIDLRPLGRGQYGQIRLCLDIAACQLCAIKICSKAALRTVSRSLLELRRPHGVPRSLSSSVHTAGGQLTPRAPPPSSPLAWPQCRGAASRASIENAGAASDTSSLCVLSGREGSSWPNLCSRVSDSRSQLLELSPAPSTTAAAAHLDAAVPPPAAFHAPPPGPAAAAAAAVALGAVSAAPVVTAPDEDALSQEVRILKDLDHPNVVRLRAAVDDPSSDTLLLVMDYVSGGCLEQPRRANGRCVRPLISRLASHCSHASS
jgi:serine/threonine protein kinase